MIVVAYTIGVLIAYAESAPVSIHDRIPHEGSDALETMANSFRYLAG